MKLRSVILRLIVICMILQTATTRSFSQEIEYKLVDTGILSHGTHGKGIEMRIQPSALPEGGLAGAAMDKALADICKFYAPSVIPFVKEKLSLENPDFIAVRVLWGNTIVGRYVLQAFEIENNNCGKKL